MTRVQRYLTVGAFAATVVAAPIAAAVYSAPAPDASAAPCLAWYGNKEDGKCLSYSNGNGVGVGTPGFGIGNGGFYTSPLFPGQTINQGIG